MVALLFCRCVWHARHLRTIHLMTRAEQPNVIRFSNDMTLRWPCRRGDFLLWMGYSNVFSKPDSVQIFDLWEMQDGYHVTISNRPEDFPVWFELHPSEVCNALVYKMMAKLERGYQPGDPMDGPNIWRLKVGDRVAWIGADRPEQTSANGILAILDCCACALAIGEGRFGRAEEFVGFGAPSTDEMNPADAERGHAAVEFVKRLGIPRTWGPEWRIG